MRACNLPVGTVVQSKTSADNVFKIESAPYLKTYGPHQILVVDATCQLSGIRLQINAEASYLVK